MPRSASSLSRRTRRSGSSSSTLIVTSHPVAGLVPATHVLNSQKPRGCKTWMRGSSPRKGIFCAPDLIEVSSGDAPVAHRRRAEREAAEIDDRLVEARQCPVMADADE